MCSSRSVTSQSRGVRKLSLRANVLVTRGPYIDRARQYILSELENRSLAFREPWLDEGDNVQQKHQLSVTARPFSRRNDAAKTYICLLGDTSQSVSRHRTHIRQPKCLTLPSREQIFRYARVTAHHIAMSKGRHSRAACSLAHKAHGRFVSGY